MKRLALLALAFSPLINALTSYTSLPIPISNFYNNQGASHNGASGNFVRGSAQTYDATLMPTGSYTYDGVTYTLPKSWGSGNDNVLSSSQVIPMPTAAQVHELHFLYAGDGQEAQTTYSFTLGFQDNTKQTVSVTAKGWWANYDTNGGAYEMPYHFAGTGRNNNLTIISQWSTAVNTTSKLTSVTFPPASSNNRMHVFAMAYTPTVSSSTPLASALSIRRLRFTSNWEQVGSQRAQVVEATIANLLPQGVARSTSNTLNGVYSFSVSGSKLSTVQNGVLNRLGPSDQARVNIMVMNSLTSNSVATVTVTPQSGSSLGTSGSFTSTPFRTSWTTDTAVLRTHETPLWWNQAKFGIFIHWGVYSVPAWAPPNVYAEWYTWTLRNPDGASNPTWEHHLNTYGKDVHYDDFIPQFTGSAFNATAWLDLFTNAGAKYFVQVTKHHDGFALFDTGETTHRSSVYLGPKRDFVSELQTTAQKSFPNMKRGTYYSLPEWFNPDYAKYGFVTWPGGLAHDPFNPSQTEPYTGHINISDYLTDLQLPHMMSLAEKYESDIMWCDVGGPNKVPQFAEAFFNQAWSQGRQVSINNRCGAPYDFDTPEYTTFGSVQTRSWESNEGMDPFSFGLNTATTAGQYQTSASIITNLVDIVSHNGNFLLDVGPAANGTIIAIEQTNLLGAGKWLKSAGSCIYSTEYWFRTAKENNLRFLTTPTTFCIISLVAPTNQQVVVQNAAPLLAGDVIQLLGAPTVSGGLKWSMSGSTLVINVPQASINAVQDAWAFEVTYKL